MKTVFIRIDEAANGSWPITLTGVDIAVAVAYQSPQAVPPGGLTPADIRDRFKQQPVQDIEAIARQLGEWACPEPVRAAIDGVRAQGQAVRVVLDVQARDLQDLPWELMRSTHLPDFLDCGQPFVRLHSSNRLPPEVEWPLRVMLVVGAAEDSNIKAEEEVFAIERILHGMSHSIDREILRRPSRDQLFKALAAFRPHVFIFIGHCELDLVAHRPVMRFQGQATGWDWGPDAVALDMANARWVPSLVLLNACRTEDARASFGFADAFVKAGVPACITMQGDVRGDLAGRFSAKVLHALFQDEPLDVAVAGARHAIAGPTPLGVADWAYPVLSMSKPEQALFPERPKHALHDHGRIFDDIQFFADRRELRRTIRDQLWKPANGAPRHLAVITGEPRCGKTHLAKWCLQNAALMFDTAVHYLPVAGSRTVDFVTLLRRMRDGFASPGSAGEAAFHAFNWTLNRILSGQAPTTWDGQPVVDEGRSFDPAVVSWEHAIRDIFDAWMKALQTLSAKRRVIIILDQFRGPDRTPAIEPRMFQDVLVPHLLRPLQQGKAPGVLMVVVMETADCQTFGIDALVPPSAWITVHPQIPEPEDQVTRELFWYPESEMLEEITLVVKQALKKVQAGGAAGLSASTVQYLCRAVAVLVFVEDDVAMRQQLGVRQMG